MSLQDFIDVAENQVGYEESSDGTTTYGEWYGLPTGAWCAMFVSWCANEAGIMTTSDTKDCPYVRKASTVRALREFYGNNNRDYVNFISLGNNVYRIQLVSDTTKYLKATGTSSGSDVIWAVLDTASNAQQWKFTEVSNTKRWSSR